jgi:enamidase
MIAAGYAADFVFLDQAQHAPGRTMLESIQQGNLPGVGMTVIDGVVRSERSRNTPPAGRVPRIVAA